MSTTNTAPDQPDCAIPATADEALDPAWLSQALSRASGGRPVIAVEKIAYLKTMATKILFRATFEGDEMPHRFCVKGLLDIDEGNRNLGSTCVAEADFYIHVAPKTDVRVPDCVSAVVDRDNQQAVIIMRDLVAEGATFCSALDVFTADDAAASIEQLSLLHRNTALLSQDWIRPRSIEISRMSAFTGDMIQHLLDDPRGEHLSSQVRSGENALAAARALADRAEMRPHFVLHGDAHAGNIYRHEGGMGLIDWQVIQRGDWAIDLAYHINAALPVEVAQAEERHLLRVYLDMMRAAGIDMPDEEQAWTQYREAVAYGFFMWAITRRVDPPIIHRFTDRLGKAAMRHKTFKLLGVV